MTLPACSAAASSLVKSITLDAILGGETRAPIRRADLEGWLRSEGGVMAADGANVLAFVDAVKGYRTRFEALPLDVQALSLPPEAMDSALSSPTAAAKPSAPLHAYFSLSARTWGLASLFRTPVAQPALPGPQPTGQRGPSDASGGDPRPSLPRTDSFAGSAAPSTRPLIRVDTFASEAIRARSGSLGSFWGEDVLGEPEDEEGLPVEALPQDPLPMHTSLDALFGRFLSRERSPRPLHHLLPHTLIAHAQQARARTTHPALLAPLDAALRDWFTETVMPRFATAAVANLHRETARGRLLCGTGIVGLGVVLAVLMLLDPSPPRRDGARVPRAVRLALLPVLLAGIGYALGSRSSLCFWLALFGVREKVDYGAVLDGKGDTDTDADAAQLGSPSRPSIETRRPSADHPPPSSQLRPTAATATRPILHRLSVLLRTLVRLAGLAYGLERVHDRRVLRAQRQGVRRIVCALLGVVAVCGVGLWFLPYIRRGAREG